MRNARCAIKKERQQIRFSPYTIGYALCAVAAVFVGPYLTDNLAAAAGEGSYKAAVAAGMLAYFSLFVFYAVRNRSGILQFAFLMAVFLLVLFNAKLIDLPDEKLHLFEYNLLGCLAMRDLSRTSLPGWRQLFYSCLFVCAVGALDESIQGIVPWRTWQVDDYVNNFAGGCSGAVMFFLCTAQRRKAVFRGACTTARGLSEK
jgi:VanZ family protein